MNRIYEVSQVNAYLKDKLDADPLLSEICVRGELSNYKIYPSGHHYFTLKDGQSALKCVMFKSSAVRLRFRPESGMQAVVTGRITVYPRDGAYQLYCDSLLPEGIGDLYVAFEQLKRRLSQEGLFDPAHKKPLPAYPHRIALVTSSAGAAVHDMLTILSRRYPLASVLLVPVRVQGTEAPGEIADAIDYVNQHSLADVIITGRGGGSIEDLWAFNEPCVAQAIYRSEIPVISAVGHEPDVTISDYVADVRAVTPSNGAELVSPDQQELRLSLARQAGRLQAAMESRLRTARETLRSLASSRTLQDPANYFADRRQALDALQMALIRAAQDLMQKKRRRLLSLAPALDAMSPLKVLGRGYGLVRTESGRVLTSVSGAETGQQISVVLADGTITSTITEIKEADHGKSVSDL